jgi:hypothetical protein
VDCMLTFLKGVRDLSTKRERGHLVVERLHVWGCFNEKVMAPANAIRIVGRWTEKVFVELESTVVVSKTRLEEIRGQ